MALRGGAVYILLRLGLVAFRSGFWISRTAGEFLLRGAASTSITFQNQADTAEVTRWFLLPRGKEYRSFRILRWETGKLEKVEHVKVVNEYLADDSTILAYKLISVKAGYSYEITWFYK